MTVSRTRMVALALGGASLGTALTAFLGRVQGSWASSGLDPQLAMAGLVGLAVAGVIAALE